MHLTAFALYNRLTHSLAVFSRYFDFFAYSLHKGNQLEVRRWDCSRNTR